VNRFTNEQVMDTRIREHADALYVKELHTISADRTREASDLARTMHQRGLTNSGIVQGNQIKLEYAIIGRQMSARLESFQRAFGDASIKPSSDELQQIWQLVTEVHKAGIARLRNQLEQQSRGTGLPAGGPERAESAVAHEPDRVLGDWQIWRTHAGLDGVQQGFSANRLQELHELPRKQDLLDDLNRLLDTELGGIAVLFIEALLDGGFDEFRFMRRSAGEAAGDRKTMAVCDRHDFTAFSAASRADSSAPFFAELKLASMKVSDRSSLPRARRSSASACNRRVSVPSRCHC
jgi:hypothetical protein